VGSQKVLKKGKGERPEWNMERRESNRRTQQKILKTIKWGAKSIEYVSGEENAGNLTLPQ